MKVLIRFSREELASSLEPARYLEHLQKASKLAGLQTTNSILANADIAHFISPIEEKQINDAYLEDFLVVISVGYCEADEKHRFFDYADNEKPVLTPRSKRVLKQADLILVPSETVKEYLLNEGVEVRIEIVTAGVDIEKIDNCANVSKNIFRKFFQNRTEKPYVICHGHGDKTTLTTIRKISKNIPGIDFYYFVDDPSIQNSIITAALTKKKTDPANLHITHVAPDDVYFSGLNEALAYLSLPISAPDYLAVFEALAANTQVIYMDSKKKHGIFQNRDNVLIASNEEKAERLIWGLATSKTQKTIKNGYEFAKANSLEVLGNQLKSAYKLINKKGSEE